MYTCALAGRQMSVLALCLMKLDDCEEDVNGDYMQCVNSLHSI